LPLEPPGEDDPPFVEVLVPVRPVAGARWIGDERDEIAFVLDESDGPRRWTHAGDNVGDARVQLSRPGGVHDPRGGRATGTVADVQSSNRLGRRRHVSSPRSLSLSE